MLYVNCFGIDIYAMNIMAAYNLCDDTAFRTSSSRTPDRRLSVNCILPTSSIHIYICIHFVSIAVTSGCAAVAAGGAAIIDLVIGSPIAAVVKKRPSKGRGHGERHHKGQQQR